MCTRKKDKDRPLKIVILAPIDSSAKDRCAFSRLLRQGKQVVTAGLEGRIAEAAWLGFAWHDGQLAGVAAIKVPRPTYRKKVFAGAGVANLFSHFSLEFGWVFVLPEFRGLGIAHTLLRELLVKSNDRNIFATTAANNQVMERILKRSGFEQMGQHFQGEQSNANIRLWVRLGNLAEPGLSQQVAPQVT